MRTRVRAIAGYDDLNARLPRPHLCGRHYWSVTKLPCVSVARIVNPSSGENTDIYNTLCLEKYFSVGLCLMSEPSMNVSAISSIFNHQLWDKYWDIILFLVWAWRHAILAVVLVYIIPPLGWSSHDIFYWLTLSISLTLGGSRSKRKLRINSCTNIRGKHVRV